MNLLFLGNCLNVQQKEGENVINILKCKPATTHMCAVFLLEMVNYRIQNIEA